MDPTGEVFVVYQPRHGAAARAPSLNGALRVNDIVHWIPGTARWRVEYVRWAPHRSSGWVAMTPLPAGDATSEPSDDRASTDGWSDDTAVDAGSPR